jgi:transcriptional regulator GlxA family with amidase domain
MLSDPKYSHYSMLGIAFECGFSSKSTFNSVFKQITGKTPSEYKNTIS